MQKPGKEVGAATLGSVVCFAKDWNEDPTSCNHVLNELAKHNKVLWVNSISTRAPNLASGKDLRKIVRRVAGIFSGMFKGATPVADNMWLFTPPVLPFHHHRWAIWLNRFLLRISLATVRRRLGMKAFQLWTFVPTSAEYVGHLGEDLVVYYCTDEWTGFSTVDGQRIGAMVSSLAKRADVVFATSRPLVEKLSKLNPNTHLASHGVKYEMFATALNDSTVVPEDIAALGKPVIAFYGLIEEWLDLDLLAYLATRHPEWSIALIGKTCVDVSTLSGFANVHFLGRKPHEALPRYCKGVTVALIPHKVNELTRHMNPIKLREYMSAGLQIVSTDLPETRHFDDHCIVAKTYADFERGIELALARDSSETRKQRSQTMQGETWDRKVAELWSIVLRTSAERNGARAH